MTVWLEEMKREEKAAGTVLANAASPVISKLKGRGEVLLYESIHSITTTLADDTYRTKLYFLAKVF